MSSPRLRLRTITLRTSAGRFLRRAVRAVKIENAVLPFSTRHFRGMRCTAAPTGVPVGFHRVNRKSRGACVRASVSTPGDVESLGSWITDNGGDVSSTKVGFGNRGRGLFASRDINKGEVVLKVPLSSVLSDGVGNAPYPDAPWSVVLAAEVLRQRHQGDDAKFKCYVNSLPKETIGFASAQLATSNSNLLPDLLSDTGALDELERYTFLLQGSAKAVAEKFTKDDWRWAMSLTHSRTFRAEEPVKNNNNKTTVRRLMVPYVDLLNHDSRDDQVSCKWEVVWGNGSDIRDSYFEVTTTQPVKVNEELLTSYGECDDRKYFLYYGFLPVPNPHNAVSLFRNLEDAASWYETLCGDGEDTKQAWKLARRKAIEKVLEETKDERVSDSSETENESSSSSGWTFADAETESAALLNLGVDAVVDDRLFRLFEILSGDLDIAIAAVRVKAKELLRELDQAEVRIDQLEIETNSDDTFAVELASEYRDRRRALLEDIA